MIKWSVRDDIRLAVWWCNSLGIDKILNLIPKTHALVDEVTMGLMEGAVLVGVVVWWERVYCWHGFKRFPVTGFDEPLKYF